MIGLRHDYSWSERALSFWATLILTVLAVTSLFLRYVTNPLSCFVPAQFEASQVDYARQFCFHAHHIYLDERTSPLPEPDEPVNPRLTYHQWLPFFLGVAALLCLLPHVTWRILSGNFLWLDAHELVRSLTTNQQQNSSARHVILRDCAFLLHAGLKGGNSVLSMVAILRKVLGCVVCFIQMLLMILVFSPQLHRQADPTEERSANIDNATIPLPVDAFTCFFPIRQISNVHRYRIMCFMPLAQVYSKGLVFLFCFFFLLFVLCALDLLLCSLRLAVPHLKDVTLHRFLSMASQSGSQAGDASPAHVSAFLDSLGLDGRWLLAVVTDRCGALTAADLTHHLLQVFKNDPSPAQGPSTAAISPADSSGAGPVTPLTQGSGGDAGAIPLVTIGDNDGDTAALVEEKGIAKVC